MMNKRDNKDFKDSTKSWILDNDYIENRVEARYYCHITRKYRASVNRDCSINRKLN